MMDVMGRPAGATAGSQIFAYDLSKGGSWGGATVQPPSASSSSGSTTTTGTASLPASIAPPNLTPFKYSTESQSYPAYLRNLGELQAQRNYQQTLNRATMGNTNQQFMHAQDALNASRLGYMGQAGQEELGIQNALASSQNEFNKALAQLYGYQVQQRGQDTDFASTQNKIAGQLQMQNNSQPGFVLGGRSATSSQLSNMGTYTPLGTGSSMNDSARGYLDRGYIGY